MRVTSLMNEARCYEAWPITAKTIGQRTQDSMWHSAARLLLPPNLALIRKVLFAIRAESGGNCAEHGKLKTARRTLCAEFGSIHSYPAQWLVLPPEFVNSAFAQEFT